MPQVSLSQVDDTSQHVRGLAPRQNCCIEITLLQYCADAFHMLDLQTDSWAAQSGRMRKHARSEITELIEALSIIYKVVKEHNRQHARLVPAE